MDIQGMLSQSRAPVNNICGWRRGEEERFMALSGGEIVKVSQAAAWQCPQGAMLKIGVPLAMKKLGMGIVV